MVESELLILLTKTKTSDEDAINIIFSNYIDIGGSIIGLSVENAVKAGKLLRAYDQLKKCKWKMDEDYYFQTECEKSFYLDYGTLKENDFIYCPFCGKQIKEVKDEQL